MCQARIGRKYVIKASPVMYHYELKQMMGRFRDSSCPVRGQATRTDGHLPWVDPLLTGFLPGESASRESRVRML